MDQALINDLNNLARINQERTPIRSGLLSWIGRVIKFRKTEPIQAELVHHKLLAKVAAGQGGKLHDTDLIKLCQELGQNYQSIH